MPESVTAALPPVRVDEDQARRYAEIVDGLHADGPRGRIIFCVSTDDLEEGKGDPYVALGLAKNLVDEGWGAALWPIRRWHESPDAEPTVAIVMIDSFVPGLLPQATATVAWIRNWTDTWAALPYLEEFDGIWCSSPDSAEVLRARYSGEVFVVPIGVDAELFRPDGSYRPLPVITTANFWGAQRQVQTALTAVSETTPVVWFGANREHLAPSRSITHADRVSFFGIASMYQRSKLVVDDLIEPARVYGSQNSRLFESIACGAVPITNSSIGLDFLGLGEVPTYHDGGSLATVVHSLLSDETALSERAERLRTVVAERHSFQRRAKEVAPLIATAIERARGRGERAAMLVWATRERLNLQSAESLRDGHLITIRRLERERAAHEKQIAELESAREAQSTRLSTIEASRAYRIGRRISRALARVRARLPRRI